MATCKLNEANEITEKNIHLSITTLCDRNCPYCCNKCYSWDEIPTVTDDELKKAENIFLTGGEPFAYGNPVAVARRLKQRYLNIKDVYVYTNLYEFVDWLDHADTDTMEEFSRYITGLNISIKGALDSVMVYKLLEHKHRKYLDRLDGNRLYIFPDNFSENSAIYSTNIPGFTIVKREWQKEFQPADDSIFRRI